MTGDEASRSHLPDFFSTRVCTALRDSTGRRTRHEVTDPLAAPRQSARTRCTPGLTRRTHQLSNKRQLTAQPTMTLRLPHVGNIAPVLMSGYRHGRVRRNRAAWRCMWRSVAYDKTGG